MPLQTAGGIDERANEVREKMKNLKISKEISMENFTIKTGSDVKRMEVKRHLLKLARVAKYVMIQMLIFIGSVVVFIGLFSWIASYINH